MRKLFSVDDHIVEPADAWSSRVPAKFRDSAPHIERDGDKEFWIVEGMRHPTVGLAATAGRAQDEWSTDPIRFSDMIDGCYHPEARARDLASEGIMASVAFPTLPRFGGALFPGFKDKELADVCVQAWNDFMFDWCSVAPSMFVPMSIVQLWDIDAAVKETQRNLDRGVRAIAIPEETSPLGLPSYYSGYFDPLFALCEAAEIPVCMHISSSGWAPFRPAESVAHREGDMLLGGIDSLDIALAMVPTITHATGWMFSPVPRKFPRLKLVFSEGGIGWVPVVLEQADRQYKSHRAWSDFAVGQEDVLPSEVLQRNMYFCMIEEEHGLANRHRIGIDRIFWECDYPHSNCLWPGTQDAVNRLFADVPSEDADRILFGNAEQVFKWKCPEVGDADTLIAQATPA